MRFIVNKMPSDSTECPFFKNGTCALGGDKCYYFTILYKYPDGDNIYYHEYGECYHLEPIESEDTE